MLYQRKKIKRQGIACVEAALVTPVFVIFTFGFIEIGYLMNSQQVLHNAARQGARVATRKGNSNAQVQSAVLAVLNNSYAIDPSSVNIYLAKLTSTGEEQYQIVNLNENEEGEPIRVTVTVDYAQFNSPSNFLGLASRSLTDSVVMQRQ